MAIDDVEWIVVMPAEPTPMRILIEAVSVVSELNGYVQFFGDIENEAGNSMTRELIASFYKPLGVWRVDYGKDPDGDPDEGEDAFPEDDEGEGEPDIEGTELVTPKLRRVA